MKFLDLKPGMEVTINPSSVRPARWSSFHLKFVRSPLFKGAQADYERIYKKYETIPLKVIEIKNHIPSPWGWEAGFVALFAENPDGKTVILSNHWFDPDDENAFRNVVPSEMREEIKKIPAKQAKDIAMGELRALPGAVDYEAAKARFGKGRTRRSRRSRKTHKVRRSRR
jgi:hypothetical protein